MPTGGGTSRRERDSSRVDPPRNPPSASQTEPESGEDSSESFVDMDCMISLGPLRSAAGSRRMTGESIKMERPPNFKAETQGGSQMEKHSYIMAVGQTHMAVGQSQDTLFDLPGRSFAIRWTRLQVFTHPHITIQQK